MPSPASTPHCPFDRLWQPGHPFRARSSRCRRWIMALLLIFMSGIVSSYWYLTDPVRIREMCQVYLSELVGGHVEVGSASLSIFQGLTLSNITVKVDKAGPADDTNLFHADAIEIQYNPASLLRGRLQATRIIATGAKAKLVENSAAGHWNYQRLSKFNSKRPGTQPADQNPLILPQLVFRDATVEYSEVESLHLVPRGSIDLEGSFFPSSDDRMYSFALQSRGRGGVGAGLSGQVNLKTGDAVLSLTDLQFGQDVQAMLPSEVRDFWLAHQLQGSVDIPELHFVPANRNHKARFKVRTELKHVRLVVRAEEFDPPPPFNFTLKKPTALPWVPTDKIAALVNDVHRTIYRMHALPEHPPIQVEDVSGAFVFDENGIHIDHLSSKAAGATVLVNGSIDGYGPEAAKHLRIETDGVVTIPEHADIVSALPGPLHQAYTMLMPHGSGKLWAEMESPAGGAPTVKGELTIVDGNFKCIFFPYPVYGATGTVAFSPDPSGTFEKVTLDVRCRGVADGPNANRQMFMTGWVGAMNPDVGCRIHAWAKGIQSEPALFAAFPPPVRKAMGIFKGPGTEKYPRITGDFDCEVFVPPGVDMRPIVSVDLNFTDGAGRLTDFPYPMEKLNGTVNVRDGYLTLNDVHLSHGQSKVVVGGKVTWPVDFPRGADVIAKPYVTLDARDVPVDATLLKVLPPEARSWLNSVGATGMLNVNGTVTPKPNATDPKDSLQWDMNVALRDGTAKPRGSDYAISDITGQLVVHTDRLEVTELHGKRGSANMSATASINWSTKNGADLHIDGTGTNVKLEPELRDLLPPDAQAGWKTLDAHGVLDAHVIYHGVWQGKPDALASISPTDEEIIPPPQQPTVNEFTITLKPTDVTVTPAPLPYRLDHCRGEVVLTPQSITATNIRATHGMSSVVLNAKGMTSNASDWDFSLSAHDLAVDKELCQALPPQVSAMIDELKYKGELSVDLTTFRYRGDKPEPDIDFTGTIAAARGSVDAGVPIDKIDGTMPFSAAVRDGKLAAFHGDMALAHLNVADRAITDFKAALDLPVKSDVLHITDLRGKLAKGELAGKLDLAFPDVGPSSYSMDFQVKNADLAEIAQQTSPGKGQQVQGQASASLALQGQWSDPTTRRGRGNVLVSGKEMYQIPLLLGLLEVTNLSLPTTTPFNEGTARYLVEGNRVTFEQVQMRSDSMVMSGTGWLDFGSKQVRMNFTTENPNIPQLPIIHDLWQGAKQELLQIQVRGTVQSPKVSAASLHTFTTTVDEVLNGKNEK